MEPEDQHKQNTTTDSALRQWIIALVLVALVLGCLGVFVALAGPGIDVSGQGKPLRLVSVITQSPFCPPEDPLLSSMLFDRKHWIVCLLGEPSTNPYEGRYMLQLVDLPLWKSPPSW